MTITLDGNVVKNLSQGMNLGGGVQLPFAAPVFFVINGDAKLKTLGGAQYYGGWCVKEEEMAEAMQLGLALPGSLAITEITTSDGSTYGGYITRNVIVAPIAVRQAWITQAKTRSTHWVEGGRHHVQVLAYMATKSGSNGDSVYTPWGAVVLSAKGYQARNLLGAFSNWDKQTAKVRRAIAPGVPAWCFYCAVGTFGKERNQVMVGSGSQSPITPIGAYLPENLSEEMMGKLFVGTKIAEAMSDYMEQAAEWLAAWRGDGSQAPVREEDISQEPPMGDYPF